MCGGGCYRRGDEEQIYISNFDRFYDHGAILYFTSKLTLVSWIKQRLNSSIMSNYVEDVYVDQSGFYDVVFQLSEHHMVLMAMVPEFSNRRLVHAMDWVPVVDYINIY